MVIVPTLLVGSYSVTKCDKEKMKSTSTLKGEVMVYYNT